MPSNHSMHLSLTKTHSDWLEDEFLRTGIPKSKIVQDLIDAQRLGGSSEVLLRKVADGITRLEGQQHRHSQESSAALDLTLALLREIFRESSANLYRLNAVIEDMPDSLFVRQKVNAFVRGRESEIEERASLGRPEAARG